GDYHHPNPPTVQASALHESFDVVLLSCKAYDLDDAVASCAPAVGPNTAILPLLNGMRHIDMLDARFGRTAVLGGLCMIASTLSENGEILHLNDNHSVIFGDRDGLQPARVAALEAELTGATFESTRSDAIVQRMWEKWVFIATGAGLTSVMRGTVGEIEAAGGAPLAEALLAECARIATEAGFPPSEASLRRGVSMFTAPGSSLTASMYRDIERGGRTECEHVLGDLLRRGRGATPMLRAAYTHVATYEIRRAAGAKF
ncbi:MAG: ketopantoate reductase family protein, partial [Gemmatimonadaceae bacterium]